MKFPTSLPPYAVARASVGRVMRLVLYALVPALLVHVHFFGWGLPVNVLLATAAALAAEWLALGCTPAGIAEFRFDVIGVEFDDDSPNGRPRLEHIEHAF